MGRSGAKTQGYFHIYEGEAFSSHHASAKQKNEWCLESLFTYNCTLGVCFPIFTVSEIRPLLLHQGQACGFHLGFNCTSFDSPTKFSLRERTIDQKNA